MIENLESRFLAARSRIEDLREQSAARNVTRAIRAEKRRNATEARLEALKAQVEALEARASSTWENNRRQAVMKMVHRARGA